MLLGCDLHAQTLFAFSLKCNTSVIGLSWWEHSCFIKLFVKKGQALGRGQDTVNQYADPGVGESDKFTGLVTAPSWELMERK